MNAYYCTVSLELPCCCYWGFSTPGSLGIKSSTQLSQASFARPGFTKAVSSCAGNSQLFLSLLLHPPFQELIIHIPWLKMVRTSIVLKVQSSSALTCQLFFSLSQQTINYKRHIAQLVEQVPHVQRFSTQLPGFES